MAAYKEIIKIFIHDLFCFFEDESVIIKEKAAQNKNVRTEMQENGKGMLLWAEELPDLWQCFVRRDFCAVHR